ncbi:zincin-like metallopeptidase domain-containing protein [uncultured Ferrimonas sp.]|uniref:zincin-like metallopeptidase domain-containing protein n=1 Tax=uncultured Ferrimonas sp. TaxID=432640 RepID=UPI002636AD79|nr:zincin-like metallopeptidase domain-containing protein [uncultured Ferrimonas sp.]
MEKNYNEKIVNEIKHAFVSRNRAVKSVKQLDFYLNRSKTSADRSTKERFEQFISDNGFTSLYLHASSDRTILSENDFRSVQKRLAEVPSDDASPRSLTVLNQVEELYRKYIEQFETSDQEYQFVKPWHDSIVHGTPKNAKTGKAYTGGNDMLLAMLQQELGLELPIFLNKHNIEELGLEVPEAPLCVGQKVVELYVDDSLSADSPDKWISRKVYRGLTDQEQQNYREQKVLRLFDLYHSSQFADGLENNQQYQNWIKDFREVALLNRLKQCRTDEERAQLFEPKIFAAKAFLHGALKQMGIEVKSHPNSCHYSVLEDQISMVDEKNFKGEHAALAYTGVLAHEMSHSTGHESRLKRKFGNGFGSVQYAFEEVVAESSAQQVMKRFNLSSTLARQSAKYVHSWLKHQKNNATKDFLSIGCNKGRVAADFILLKGREYQQTLADRYDGLEFQQLAIDALEGRPDADALFLAEYVNSVSYKALERFFEEQFDGLEGDEKLLLEMELENSPDKHLMLQHEFYDLLEAEYGISEQELFFAGDLTDQYSLMDIFDNGVDQPWGAFTVTDALKQKLNLNSDIFDVPVGSRDTPVRSRLRL